jgi:hypothetical protein
MSSLCRSHLVPDFPRASISADIIAALYFGGLPFPSLTTAPLRMKLTLMRGAPSVLRPVQSARLS